MPHSALRGLILLLVVLLVAAPCVPKLVRAAEAADEETEAEFDAFAEDEPVEEVDEKDVLVLTEKNFNETVLKAPFALVEFYAPWCGHCQALKPEYAKAATQLKALNGDIILAKVDATEEPELASSYSVTGYPTLKWFVDGKDQEYSGGRIADEIVKWVKKKSGPPAETIRRMAEYQEIKKQTVYLIAFFDEFEGASHEAFLEAAKLVEDVPFYRTTDLSVAKKVGITKPGFVLTRNYPGAYGESAFLKDVSVDALVLWVQEEKLPPYLEFTDDNQGVIFNSGIKINVIVMGSKEQLAPGGAMVKAIEAAHLATKGKIVFVTSDLASENAEALVDFFEVDPKAKDIQVVAFNLDTYAKYRLDEAPDAATLKAFAEGIVSGVVKPHYKSEEIPTGEDAEDGDVLVVVGKNFEQIVLDETKDVLLEVYAPWCGHCKAIAPTYRKLAKRFRPVDSVVIAKMDGTANEHENVTVEGYPSLFLFPAGKGAEPVPYEDSDRSLKGLTQFIKEHASGKFELPKKQTEEEDKADAEEAAARDAEEQAAEYGGEDEELEGDAEFDIMEAAEMQAAERQQEEEEEEDEEDVAGKDEL